MIMTLDKPSRESNPTICESSLQTSEPIRHNRFQYAMSIGYKCFVVYTLKKLMVDLNK